MGSRFLQLTCRFAEAKQYFPIAAHQETKPPSAAIGEGSVVQRSSCTSLPQLVAGDRSMSVPSAVVCIEDRTEPAQPKVLCSLTELSRTLDQSSEATPFADLGARSPRLPRRRWVEGWHLMILSFGGLWFLFWGFLATGVPASSQPSFNCGIGHPPATELEPDIPQLDDPVLAGRGGRAPQVVNALAEAPPGADCLGTQVAFVNGLAEATRQSKEHNKLLMILNVSGDFDDSRFT
jgi:hypothetical protein